MRINQAPARPALSAKGVRSTPSANASYSNAQPDSQLRIGPVKRTSGGHSSTTNRFVVCEERKQKMSFLGIAPAASPEQAIAIIRRYAMRGDDVRMDAKPLKVTKK